MKILKYQNQLEDIAAGVIPDPIMIEFDPCDFCNFGCSWCSSGHHLWEEKRPKHLVSIEQFDKILKFVDHIKSVKGFYFVGGGEPTLNKDLPVFMEKTKERGINNYITNNGSNLTVMAEKLIDLCQWVAVSVNSGSEEHWRKVFKTKMSYEKYVDGLKKLNAYNKSTRNIETVYKHTFDPETYVDIEKAYFKAIEYGFNHVLIKPVDMFIYKRNEKVIPFNQVWPEPTVKTINRMIENIKLYNSKNPIINLDCGGFYGDINEDSHRKPHCNTCWTSMMDPVFGADGNIHLCCVRRSEKLVGRWDDDNLINYWGSQEHKDKVWGFNPNMECPTKCKNKSYNQIFQDIYIDKKFSEGHI